MTQVSSHVELLAQVSFEFGQCKAEANLTITSYEVSEVFFAQEEEDTEGNKTYTKITDLRIGKEIWIVVKGSNLKDKKVTVNILDANTAIATKKNTDDVSVVPVLIGEDEKTDIEVTLDQIEGEGENEKKYGVVKVKLRPKSDTDLKTFTSNIKSATDKKAKLYLSADAHTPNSDIESTEVTYDGSKNDYDVELTNIWLNTEDEYLNVYSCFCDRDFTGDELIKIIYHLRDKFNYKSNREVFFNLGVDHFTNNRTTDLANNKNKVDTFKDELNSMFTKFGINTCKRKIHFIAQMYIETMHFRSTHEGIGRCDNYKGGCDFRGRGMKQITHDYNYLAYYDYLNDTDYTKTYDNLRGKNTEVPVKNYLDKFDKTEQEITTDFYNNTLIPFTKDLSQNLFEAFDSAGWYSTIYRKDVLSKMDNGLDAADVEKVTFAINGGKNELTERQNAAKFLKSHFNYDNQCISKQ